MNPRPTERDVMKRIPELDALRGLAAVAILAFHLKPSAFAPGWTGVDLFFVLSGYLITGIILEHGESKGFLMAFYARRGLRIWPIYYLTLFVLVAVNPYLPKPDSLAALPNFLTYTQNIQLFWKGTAPIWPQFGHTWTLALEEQFYLIWPALLLLAGRRRVVAVCLATIALGYMARDGGWFSYDRYSQDILIGRCDGFALGGLLAALLRGGSSRRVRLGIAGAFLGAVGYFAWGILAAGSATRFLGLPTPPDPAGTILAVGVLYFGLVGLVVIGAGSSWLAPLRLRPLRYLGQISYGLYLYHYPTFWAIDGFRFVYDQSWTIRAVKLAATLVIAVISWHLIESPILRLKERFRYDRRGGVAAIIPHEPQVDAAAMRQGR
jgi:peptidoglycan/LPS O-acetylase OafA/YrhL